MAEHEDRRRPSSGDSGASPELDARFAAATRQHRQGRLAEAEQLYRDVIAAAPGHRHAHNNLAVVLHSLGRRDEAVASYRRALEIDPSNADAYSNLSVLLRESGRLDEALAACRKALRLAPDHADANYNLGVTLLDTSEHAAAVPYLRAATVANPDHHLAHANLARALFFTARVDEALAHGRRTLEIKDRTSVAGAAPDAPGGPAAPAIRTVPVAAERPQRNVIAFSLWGGKAIYTEGAIENARLARSTYPQWTCRFYHDRTVPGAVLDRLADLGAALVLIDEPEDRPLGPFWRFYAADDPAVDRFICRDCDSRLNGREHAAVEAWIQSGKPFHVMRDAVVHTELILAGMWGGVAGVLPSLRARAIAYHRPGRHRWRDQDFLRLFVWPLIRAHCLTHDTYYRFGTEAWPFPDGDDRPDDGHVGAIERPGAAS